MTFAGLLAACSGCPHDRALLAWPADRRHSSGHGVGHGGRCNAACCGFRRDLPKLEHIDSGHDWRGPDPPPADCVIVRRMPELPDIVVYVEHLERRIAGATLESVRVASPNLLRTFDPPLDAVHARRVTGLRRVGKRIVIALEGGLFLVIHLMISGRLRWSEGTAKLPGKVGLATFTFSTGTLGLTEASQKKRASLHVVRGEDGLAALDPGGIEPLEVSREGFAAALRS